MTLHVQSVRRFSTSAQARDVESSDRRGARNFRITRAMRGAEYWTDHRLVRSVVKLYIAPTHRKKSKFVRPSYNIANLKHPETTL
ncbi:hypothetical protein ACOMHN_016787 [Nucella lapillus]